MFLLQRVLAEKCAEAILAGSTKCVKQRCVAKLDSVGEWYFGYNMARFAEKRSDERRK
jgi:hypothetical protein